MVNTLEYASRLAELLDEYYLEREVEEVVDCLLDKGDITLRNATINEAHRQDTLSVPQVYGGGEERGNPKGKYQGWNVVDFCSYRVAVDPARIFSAPLDISITVIRNLSNEQSHASEFINKSALTLVMSPELRSLHDTLPTVSFFQSPTNPSSCQSVVFAG